MTQRKITIEQKKPSSPWDSWAPWYQERYDGMLNQDPIPMVRKNGQPIILPHGQPKKAQPLTPRTITMRHGLHGVENRCPKVSINQGNVVTSDKRFETDMSNICKQHTVEVVMPEPCGVAVRCAGGKLSYADCREVTAHF